jgi:hypothetical protein
LVWGRYGAALKKTRPGLFAKSWESLATWGFFVSSPWAIQQNPLPLIPSTGKIRSTAILLARDFEFF